MIDDIYDPLKEYVSTFAPRFKEVAEQTFSRLAAEANIDVEANRQICAQISAADDQIADLRRRIMWWRVLEVFLWVVIVGVILTKIILSDYKPSKLCIYCLNFSLVGSIIILFWELYPTITGLQAQRDASSEQAEVLRKEAFQQMEPLNRLYDWDILTRMMTQTVPRLEFDRFFTTQRLADLVSVYDWDEDFNSERSVVYSHSGLINGNPFVICRTRKMEMGEKTYEGTKTIEWTEQERDSEGKMQTVTRSQVLHAYVTAPYPEYFEKTRLIYGNTAAPDLVFNRFNSGLAGKEGSISHRWTRHKLRNKSRDLAGSDYAMMTNEDFEVAFDTSDRNNNQQFALLFTPLAQLNMMALLTDKEVGYGDDFDFHKHRMINTIVSGHMQSLDLDFNPSQFHRYSIDQAHEDFCRINAEYFRAIYFALAPLLTVPMYQQIRPIKDYFRAEIPTESCYWEHEVQANLWGIKYFRHPSCVTDCILKTQSNVSSSDQKEITVFAHGFRRKQRVTYVDKYGDDGRYHSVPVYWDEYFPVTGKGTMILCEDSDFDDSQLSHTDRMAHIHSIVSQIDSRTIYRRHIASTIIRN